MKVGIFYKKMVVLIFVLLTLASCSSNIGPSDKKVRLDVDESVQTMSQGLFYVSDFTLDSRDELSEDRVKFHITLTYEMDEEKIKEYKASVEHSARMFGGLGSMKSMRRSVQRAQQQDGATEKATWLYQLTGKDIWELVDSKPGHQ